MQIKPLKPVNLEPYERQNPATVLDKVLGSDEFKELVKKTVEADKAESEAKEAAEHNEAKAITIETSGLHAGAMGIIGSLFANKANEVPTEDPAAEKSPIEKLTNALTGNEDATFAEDDELIQEAMNIVRAMGRAEIRLEDSHEIEEAKNLKEATDKLINMFSVLLV